MTTEQMRQLRTTGMTYQAIAEKAGISTQAVHLRLNPEHQREYQREYQKTPQQLEYHRHRYHQRVNKLFPTCEKCKGTGETQ